jgi:hypothetical protein
VLLRDVAVPDEHEARSLVPMQSRMAVIQALSLTKSQDGFVDGESTCVMRVRGPARPDAIDAVSQPRPRSFADLFTSPVRPLGVRAPIVPEERGISVGETGLPR